MMRAMPRVQPFDRPATYDDLIAVPDIMVAEIVDGELHASPRPAPRHARAGASLAVLVGGPFDLGRGGPGGGCILYEPEPTRSRPCSSRAEPAGAGPGYPACQTPPTSRRPDWMARIVSPSTASSIARRSSGSAHQQVAYVDHRSDLARSGPASTLPLDDSATHAGDEVVRAGRSPNPAGTGCPVGVRRTRPVVEAQGKTIGGQWPAR
jgi:hypothetical protein